MWTKSSPHLEALSGCDVIWLIKGCSLTILTSGSVSWDKVVLLHGFASKTVITYCIYSWNTTDATEESTLQAPRPGTRLPPPISSSYIRSSPYITSPYNVRYICYVSSLSIHISCWSRSYLQSYISTYTNSHPPFRGWELVYSVVWELRELHRTGHLSNRT